MNVLAGQGRINTSITNKEKMTMKAVMIVTREEGVMTEAAIMTMEGAVEETNHFNIGKKHER